MPTLASIHIPAERIMTMITTGTIHPPSEFASSTETARETATTIFATDVLAPSKNIVDRKESSPSFTTQIKMTKKENPLPRTDKEDGNACNNTSNEPISVRHDECYVAEQSRAISPGEGRGLQTMAELDAQECDKKAGNGCRRSARQSNRRAIKTTNLERINQLFWKGDSLYHSVDGNAHGGGNGSIKEDEMHNTSKDTTHAVEPQQHQEQPPNAPQPTNACTAVDVNASFSKQPQSLKRKRCHSRPLTSDNSKNNLQLPGYNRFNIEKVHDSPHVYVMDDFLKESELQYLMSKITAQSKKFTKSFVDDTSTASHDKRSDSSSTKSMVEEKEQRTSSFLELGKMEHSKIASIERRVAELLGLSNTAKQLEPLQLVRYFEGEYFGIHHDTGALYDDGSVELPAKSPWSKRRIVTIFVYLNHVPRGGCTHFPELVPVFEGCGSKDGNNESCDGLRIEPKPGRAVLFCNITRDGVPDPRLVHAGEAVLGLCDNSDGMAATATAATVPVVDTPDGKEHVVLTNEYIPCNGSPCTAPSSGSTSNSAGTDTVEGVISSAAKDETCPNGTVTTEIGRTSVISTGMSIAIAKEEENGKGTPVVRGEENDIRTNNAECTKKATPESKPADVRKRNRKGACTIQNVKYGINIWVTEE